MLVRRLAVGLREPRLHELQRRLLEVELVRVVLVDERHPRAAIHGDKPFRRRQMPEHDLHQRRLPVAVFAEKAHAGVAVEAHVDVREQVAVHPWVPERHALEPRASRISAPPRAAHCVAVVPPAGGYADDDAYAAEVRRATSLMQGLQQNVEGKRERRADVVVSAPTGAPRAAGMEAEELGFSSYAEVQPKGFVSRLVAQCAVQPGLSRVYEELLSQGEGAEIYGENLHRFPRTLSLAAQLLYSPAALRHVRVVQVQCNERETVALDGDGVVYVVGQASAQAAGASPTLPRKTPETSPLAGIGRARAPSFGGGGPKPAASSKQKSAVVAHRFHAPVLEVASSARHVVVRTTEDTYFAWGGGDGGAGLGVGDAKGRARPTMLPPWN